MNQEARSDLYGYKLHEVVGQNPRILKSSRTSPQAYKDLWVAITDPAVGHWHGEVVNRRKMAPRSPCSSRSPPVLNGAGKVIGFIASALDITRQRKQMERKRCG